MIVHKLQAIDTTDYWSSVTGIPCPRSECIGTILWYEVGAQRICSHCQIHYLAAGDVYSPCLVETDRHGCLPEHEAAFAAMRHTTPPMSIEDERVPLPGRRGAESVPENVLDRVRTLLQVRDVAMHDMSPCIAEIDSTILYLLSPYTERLR